MTPHSLSPTVWTSPQPAVDAMAGLAASGVRRIICNRPDGEDPDQLAAAEMEAAARAAGLDFVWIPIIGLPGPEQVAAVAARLADGVPTLMYCRSGTRSTVAWAMAERGKGVDAEALRAAAAGAGYDLSRTPL